MKIDFENFFLENSTLISQLLEMPMHKAILKVASLQLENKNQIIQQIAIAPKMACKLPTWAKNNKIIYPPSIYFEQCSSEIAANFKSKILSKPLLVDLTGGFGVDTFCFSKNYNSVIYIEKNTQLFDIVAWNFVQLNVQNVQIFNQDCATFLANFEPKKPADDIVFFIDPARRDAQNNKLVSFADTQPNILELLPKLFTFANTILLKASPMMDIELAIKELKNVANVFVISIKNECKELLFELKNIQTPIANILAVNIESTKTDVFECNKLLENQAFANYSNPLKCLYEPNVAILKAGVFKTIANVFQCFKISANTHLYTSEVINRDFQGRIFEIISPIHLKEIKNHILNNKVNIITRNYPLTPQEIKTKYKIIDGGELYLICFKNKEEKPITLLCKRII